MKHTLKITLLIVLLFLAAQLVGLAVLSKYVDPEATKIAGETTYDPLPYNIERPDATPTATFIYIISAVVIGTVLILLIARFKKPGLWKAWFFLSVLLTLSISFSAFIRAEAAFALAFALSLAKVFRQSSLIHNATEVFLYGGLAVIFVPILNVLFALVLIVVISVYDMFAVWKTRHMVGLARFQSASKTFAGLYVPYTSTQALRKGVKARAAKAKTAVLGGGDIAFPLIFAGTVMQAGSQAGALAVSLAATAALALLLFFAKKGRFYPAMPFLTAGCAAGYAISILIF